MKKDIRHIDPELPEDVGNNFPPIPDREEFLVPENYFEELPSRIQNRIHQSEKEFSTEATEEYFENSAEQILKLARLEKIVVGHGAEEFKVPAGYFDSLEQKVSVRIHEPVKSGRIIHMTSRFNWKQVLIPAAAAAAIIVAVFMLLPEKTNLASTNSFDELLASAEISDDDLEYFTTEDDLYELYLDEVNEFMSDTIVEPAGQTQKPKTLQDKTNGKLQALPNGQAGTRDKKLSPEKQNAPGSKANKKENTPLNFDELTEDEILDYLLNEGDETDDL